MVHRYGVLIEECGDANSFFGVRFSFFLAPPLYFARRRIVFCYRLKWARVLKTPSHVQFHCIHRAVTGMKLLSYR